MAASTNVPRELALLWRRACPFRRWIGIHCATTPKSDPFHGLACDDMTCTSSCLKRGLVSRDLAIEYRNTLLSLLGRGSRSKKQHVQSKWLVGWLGTRSPVRRPLYYTCRRPRCIRITSGGEKIKRNVHLRHSVVLVKVYDTQVELWATLLRLSWLHHVHVSPVGCIVLVSAMSVASRSW